MYNIKDLQNIHIVSYWWNMKKRKIDFNGNLKDCLNQKHIGVKKVNDSKNPGLDCFVFTTPHRIIYKHFGSVEDGAFTALKLWYATMGDKAKITMRGKTFTFNH